MSRSTLRPICVRSLAGAILCCTLAPSAATPAGPAVPVAAAARATETSPVGFWTLRSAAGDCEGLERATPEAQFTADGRFSFASRSYVLGGGGADAGCCTVRWGRVGLWRATDDGLRLDALSIPVEARGRALIESVTLRGDGLLEVRVPETACTLAFARAADTADWRHAQTRERLQQCVQVRVTKPGAGASVEWGDSVQIEMRVRSPTVLASNRVERSTVEPGSQAMWKTIEYALVGHAPGARLRVTACPELTLAGVPPEQMPTEPIVADVRILARAAAEPTREPGPHAR